MASKDFESPRSSTLSGSSTLEPGEDNLNAKITILALPSKPPPASERVSNVVDDFFGYTPHRSQTRDAVSDNAAMHVLELPTHANRPPGASKEPATLVMYLFKFGFLFPPFWVIGSCVLVSRLHIPRDWNAGKPEAERQALYGEYRKTEVKWGKRCLIGLISELVLVGLVVGLGVGLRQH